MALTKMQNLGLLVNLTKKQSVSKNLSLFEEVAA